MSIFSGATEILAGKLQLGATVIQEVYYGALKIWPPLALFAMQGDRTRYCSRTPGSQDWATTDDAFWFGFTFQFMADGTEHVICGDSSSNFISQNGSGTISVRLGGSERTYSGALTNGYIHGEVVTLKFTRAAGATSWGAEMTNGVVFTYSTANASSWNSRWRPRYIYWGGSSSWDQVSTAMWNLAMDNFTKDVKTTVPLDEGTGLNSIMYKDDVAQGTPYVWTPDVDWIDQPAPTSKRGYVNYTNSPTVDNWCHLSTGWEWPQDGANEMFISFIRPPNDGVKRVLWGSEEMPGWFVDDDLTVEDTFQAGLRTITFVGALTGHAVGSEINLQLNRQDINGQMDLYINGVQIGGTLGGVSTDSQIDDIGHSTNVPTAGTWPVGSAFWDGRVNNENVAAGNWLTPMDEGAGTKSITYENYGYRSTGTWQYDNWAPK